MSDTPDIPAPRNAPTHGTGPSPEPPDPQLADQTQEVKVSPRYLAGGGIETEATFEPLLQAGWLGWGDELANHHLTSPCGRAYLGFLPEHNPEPLGLWKAWARPDHHSPRTWIAGFDDHVPYEMVQAFTTAWATSYQPHDPAFAHADRAGADGIKHILSIAGDAGWEPDHFADGDLRRLTAPDGRAAIEVRARSLATPEQECAVQPQWAFWAAPAPYRRPLWEAFFTSATPTSLVAAFTLALVDPDPLVRDPLDIPATCRDRITLG